MKRRQAVELESDERDRPPLRICESRPGKFVFIERGNRDAWIASDDTVDVVR